MSEPLNTYGLEPSEGQPWKLFTIDGWPLLVQMSTNDSDEGWGIRYSTSVRGFDGPEGLDLSVWAGATNSNPKIVEVFEKTFREMDEAKARAGLQLLLDNVAPVLHRMQR